MHPGVFTLICPVCEGEIAPSGVGRGSCTRCGSRYLIRAGLLLLVSGPTSATADGIDLRPSPSGVAASAGTATRASASAS